MRALSGLDASFLVLETDNAPMHISGVSILDSRLPDGGRFDLDRLKRLLSSRLDRSRALRERLVEAPLDIARPSWVDDPHFDIDRHVERTELPAPGGWHELRALMAWEMSHALPRDRPLWHMVLAEGVNLPGAPEDAVAVIGKVHHAAIDGVSGAEMLGALFDPDPEAGLDLPALPPAQPAGQPLSNTAMPNALDHLRQASRGLLAEPGEIGGTIGRVAKGLARSGAAWGIKRVKPPPLPFTAPRTVLNAPVSKERAWAGAVLPLDRIKAIKEAAAHKTTVNDIVLAVCGGALRRYLDGRDALPAESLIAMVPVSVRTEDERGDMGNKVSAMLVDLATDVSDPIARTVRVRQSAASAKVHHEAIGARTLSSSSDILPFSLSGMAARLYTRMELAERHRPIFNLVVTNVPGPQVPLYLSGARLLHHLGAAPIFDGLGLTLAIFSYNGELAIGATACRKLLPDVEALAAGFSASLEELETSLT